MSKILKPYTIIPEELYVQRDADRQVERIISDMGRPGYVLVSRQMGKTNLLLNAKRKLESDNTIFIYIDLSNFFPNAKSCFENIIDTAIDTYPDKFVDAAKTIYERRIDLTDTPPHKQHTNELRLLLRSVADGKIIIVLDEIDALTKTDYSDQIFSQIRSSYFASRVNYKEFYNLTYLLSGVVEPSEIIKDPKISPFNIGQKIYLNDFSKAEFNAFLSSANLNLQKDIAERVFYWTNGNPRMTWDVCAEVESQLLSHTPSIEGVDKIVSDLYLTAFDKPPIDNIREMVKQDREIRNSIIEIEFEKGREVSDRLKNKLYLAGIINYDEDNIHIKNEIIRKSLSFDWIRELEEEDKGLIKIALEEYQKLKYSDSLLSFEKYLSTNQFADGQDRASYYYIMGHCSYTLHNFGKALEYFDNVSFDIEDDIVMYHQTLSYKGLTYYYLNRLEESLTCLRIVIDNGKKDAIYAQALLNYCGISLKSDRVTHRDQVTKILEEIINETAFKKDKLKPEYINEIKSIAYYYLGQIQALTGDREKAVENYKSALDYSLSVFKPKIILAALSVTSDKELQHDLLSQLVDLISSGTVIPKEEESEMQLEFSFSQLRNVFIYSFLHFYDTLFVKLKPHLSLLGNPLLPNNLFDLAFFSIQSNKDWATGIKLLNEVHDIIKDGTQVIEDKIRYSTLKLLSYFTEVTIPATLHIQYISLFEKERLESIDFIDMSIFAKMIFFFSEKKDTKEALHYANIINSLKGTVPENHQCNYLVIYHLELIILNFLNNRAKAVEKAKEIILMANDERIASFKSELLGEEGLEIVKQNAELIINPNFRRNIPIKIEKSYGRNEIIKVRYKDGTILETKYKKVDSDIKSGLCYILEQK